MKAQASFGPSADAAMAPHVAATLPIVATGRQPWLQLGTPRLGSQQLEGKSRTRQPHHRASAGQCQAGLTLVELMVGMAIGLLLIAGATSLFLANLGASRALLLEARLNQNLRLAAEIITRDLRRAGYWDQAVAALGTGSVNPYQDIVASATSVAYAYSAPAGAASAVRFSWSNDRLQMTIGNGSAQELTDPAVARVTGFQIVAVEHQIDLGAPHAPALPAGARCLTERRYDLTIDAEAPHDATVKRRLQSSVRVRNGRIGDCV